MYVITIQPKEEYGADPAVSEVKIYNKDFELIQPCMGTATDICKEWPEFLIEMLNSDGSPGGADSEWYYCDKHLGEMVSLLVPVDGC